ncbi:MAG: hypothetical protein IPL28_22805 [Chloroflexi bacterium]|nr:hypothetical protein [Chloroflexota bacterium]
MNRGRFIFRVTGPISRCNYEHRWRDPTRPLWSAACFVAEWTWLGLAMALLRLGGWAGIWHNWRWAAISTTWSRLPFYCLTKFVPDTHRQLPSYPPTSSSPSASGQG